MLPRVIPARGGDHLEAGGKPEMAKSEVQIKGDVNAAMQSFVNSVTYMGGSVTSMNPARPVEFSVRRAAGIMGGVGAPYAGMATFVPTPNNQTRVLIELKPKAWYTALMILIGLVAIALLGNAGGGEDEATLIGIAVVIAAVIAVIVYFYYVPWPQKLLDKLLSGIHGAVSAFDVNGATAAVPGPAFAPAAPEPASAASAGIADQLRQIAELHEQGLISEAEMQTKRAELLKRL